MHILVCSIDSQLYGLDLENVERSIPAMDVTPMPNAAPHILGAVNLHGRIIPVTSVRALLGIPTRELDINDHFVVCKTHERPFALWVDRVKLVRSCQEADLLSSAEIMPGVDGIQFVLKDDGHIILIFDLNKLIPIHVA